MAWTHRSAPRLGVPALAAVLISLASAPTAGAATPITATPSSVTVAGTSVTTSTSMTATRATTASQAGTCVRNASGARQDFVTKNVRLGTAATTITRTRTLATGTYTYWPCAYVSGVWHSLGASGTFTVSSEPSTAPRSALPATAIAGNLLDLNSQSATIDISRWTPFDSPVVVTETVDPLKVIDGSRSVRGQVTAPGDVRVFVNPRVTGVVAGIAYRVSTWIRPDQVGTGAITLAWYDSAGRWTSATNASLPLSANTAGQVQLEATAPAGAVEALVSIGLNGARTGDTFTFDRTYIGTAYDTAGSHPQSGTTAPPSTGAAMPAAATLPASTGAPNGWTRVLAEDFDREVAAPSFPSAYPSVQTYPDTWTNSTRTSWYGGGRTISVSQGVLRKRVHTDAQGRHRTETLVPAATQNMLYGRYQIRWRVPNALPGYKVAWLLWPTSEVWPRDGEIDFPEGSLSEGSRIEAFMHRQGATVGSDQDAFISNVPTTGSQWHTTEIIWAPGFSQFTLDGQVIGTSTYRVPNTPMGWRIQTEGNLNGSSLNTGISPATAGDVEIDWIAAYARNA